eukprot:GFYU01005174.1.p1 GENE.GFYU01005174.1~~GFYU01005174.1.p1  ORF type:complete len:713 (+),score=262.27 GFYU01005174.1:25-2163(+)
MKFTAGLALATVAVATAAQPALNEELLGLLPPQPAKAEILSFQWPSREQWKAELGTEDWFSWVPDHLKSSQSEAESYVFPNVDPDRCTSITVGASASVDGSTMTTHTNDCFQCDTRIVNIPAMDHPEGAKRAVYFAEGTEFPRYVGPSDPTDPRYRGPNYVLEGYPLTESIGEIPQVAHTYSYFDGSYGIMNEKQVGIGESTCACKIAKKSINEGGDALFDIIELSKVALERAATAREAVNVITELADQYGYYSQSTPEATVMYECGEALTIIDPKEAWVLNMMADPTGRHSIWAAKRVPDEEVAVTANFFTVGDIYEEDTDNYMLSKNAKKVAIEMGWWNPEVNPVFNFARAYAGIEEFKGKKDYWNLRMWRVFSILAPSLKLNGMVDSVLDLPFSVKPETKVSQHDIMNLHRDVYQGTEFDLTAGPAAGPFGSPLRVEGMSHSSMLQGIEGEFARAISLMRCAYSTVLQCRSNVPAEYGSVMWIGQDAPHSTVYTPFYATATDTAPSYRTGHSLEFTRESAWWAFDFVSNWAELKWSYMMDDIREKQLMLETQTINKMIALEAHVGELLKTDRDAAIKLLTQWGSARAESIVDTWWTFADTQIVKYNDGYVNQPAKLGGLGGHAGYPAWWLNFIGYDKTPYAHTTATLSHTSEKADNSDNPISNTTIYAACVCGVIMGVLGALIGYNVGRSKASKEEAASPNYSYMNLNG